MRASRNTKDKYRHIRGRDGKDRVNNWDHRPVIEGRERRTGLQDAGYPLELWEVEEPAEVSQAAMADPLKGLGAVSSVDLSTDVHFPMNGDQQQVNSCAAWSMAYYCLGYQLAKAMGWSDAALGNQAHLLSPDFCYYRQAAGDSNNGTFMTDVAQTMMDWGCATQATMPPSSTFVDNWGTDAAQREALIYRVASITPMAGTVSTIVNDIKAQLNAGIPVTIAINGSSANYGLIKTYGGMTAANYDDSTMNHAQTVVGYNDSAVVGSETGCFIIVNSWGGGQYYSKYYMSYACMQLIKNSGTLFPTVATFKFGAPTYLAKVTFSTPMQRNLRLDDALYTAQGSEVTDLMPDYAIDDGAAPAYFPNPMEMDISGVVNGYASHDTFRLMLELVSTGGTSVYGTISSLEVQYFPSYSPTAVPTVVEDATGLPLSTFGSATVALIGGSTVVDTHTATVTTLSIGQASVLLGQSVTLSGTVMALGVPLSGAKVTFAASNGDAIPATSTNTAGAYSVVYTPSKVGTVSIIASFAGSA